MKRHYLRFSIANLFISLLFVLLTPGRSVAQTGEPVFRSKADYTFGQMMRFRLTIDNIEPIESITLFFKAPEFPNAFSTDVPFTMGGRIEVAHDIDLSQQVRLAPFTEVTYWWLMTTEAGRDIITPKQVIAYRDSQFEWRQLGQDQITVNWTGDDPGLGQLALDIVVEALPRLQSIIPVKDLEPLQVYIYPSSADLRSALRLTGRDWVGAHADPELGVILVTAVNTRTAATDLRQSIPHEMAHFLLYQAVGTSYDTLPLWFNEGLATTMESLTNPSYEIILESAVTNQTTIPFAELCHSFPATEERALLAYAQSASMVRFIQARYGNQKLSDMVSAFADGADCQSGVVRGLQTTLAELDQAWLRDRQPNSTLFRLLSENGLWLLLLIGGFGVTRLLIVNPDENKDA